MKCPRCGARTYEEDDGSGRVAKCWGGHVIAYLEDDRSRLIHPAAAGWTRPTSPRLRPRDLPADLSEIPD